MTKKLLLVLGIVVSVFSCTTDNEPAIIDNTGLYWNSLSRSVYIDFNAGSTSARGPVMARAIRPADPGFKFWEAEEFANDGENALVNEVYEMHHNYFPEQEKSRTYSPSYFDAIYAAQANGDVKNVCNSFMYVSNGEPVTFYPIYSYCGQNVSDQFVLFWIDQNGEIKIKGQNDPDRTNYNIWENNGDWKTYNNDKHIDSHNAICIKNTCFKATSFQLPEGTKFGFLLFSSSKRHFSKIGYNVSMQPEGMTGHPEPSIVSYDWTSKTNGKDFTVMGVERSFQVDYDYNDLVFLLDPHQKTYTGDEIEIDINENFICLSDDFNINLGDNPTEEIKEELGLEEGQVYVAVPTGTSKGEFQFNGTIYLSGYNANALNSSNELAFRLDLYSKKQLFIPTADEPIRVTEIPQSEVRNIPEGFEFVKCTKTIKVQGADNVCIVQVDLILKKKDEIQTGLIPEP